MVHVVSVSDLGRTTVSASVCGDHPVTVLQEEQHLGVPVVGRERPAMAEHDRLSRPPILVKISTPSLVVMVLIFKSSFVVALGLRLFSSVNCDDGSFRH